MIFFLHTRTCLEQVVQLHVLVEIQHDIKIIIPYRMFSSFMDENRTIIITSKELHCQVKSTKMLLWCCSCCRQCDFSAPFEWKRNLHSHCYTSPKHSALACCTITRSLLCCCCCCCCGRDPQFIAKLQTTVFTIQSSEDENVQQGSGQTPFLIDCVWLVDVHMIDLMCCLLHINLRHSLG